MYLRDSVFAVGGLLLLADFGRSHIRNLTLIFFCFAPGSSHQRERMANGCKRLRIQPVNATHYYL